MNFHNYEQNQNSTNNEELEYEAEEEEEDCQYIDPNDINIIEDSNNWKPSPKYVVAYAKQLGFDPDRDPKELINIAEKYLNIKLPDNIRRAFMKDTLQILYIDMNTQEIKINTEIEDKAKEEFEKIREQFKNRLKGLNNGLDNRLKQSQGLGAPPTIMSKDNNNNNINKITDDELKKKI